MSQIFSDRSCHNLINIKKISYTIVDTCGRLIFHLLFQELQLDTMNSAQKYLLYILNIIGSAISYIPAAIYAYIYAECFTKYSWNYGRPTYHQIGQRNADNKKIKNVLDIGTATGGPLKTIVPHFTQARILGIDYNQHYVPACQKLFKDHANVEIKHMNFYDLEKQEPETQFDIIIFGSSFMILPDQAKALEIARRTLVTIQANSPKKAKSTSCWPFTNNGLFSTVSWSLSNPCSNIFAPSISAKWPTVVISSSTSKTTVWNALSVKDAKETLCWNLPNSTFTKQKNVNDHPLYFF